MPRRLSVGCKTFLKCDAKSVTVRLISFVAAICHSTAVEVSTVARPTPLIVLRMSRRLVTEPFVVSFTAAIFSEIVRVVQSASTAPACRLQRTSARPYLSTKSQPV